MPETRLIEATDVPEHLREATTHVLTPRSAAASTNRAGHRFDKPKPYEARHAVRELVEPAAEPIPEEHARAIATHSQVAVPQSRPVGESTVRMEIPESPTVLLPFRSPGAALAAPVASPFTRLSARARTLGGSLLALRKRGAV